MTVAAHPAAAPGRRLGVPTDRPEIVTSNDPMSLGSGSVCNRRDRNPVRTGSVPVREPMDHSGPRQSPRVRKRRSSNGFTT
jgi:hypothetical protein